MLGARVRPVFHDHKDWTELRFGTEVVATFPRARVMDALAPVVEKKPRLQIYSEAK